MFDKPLMTVKRMRSMQILRRYLERFMYTPTHGTHYYEYTLPETTVEIHGEGLGDVMIIRQVGRAIEEYAREYGDPELGHVVIATGGYTPGFHPNEGDINIYWWWTFGDLESRPAKYLKHYIEQASVTPDIILCPSSRTLKQAGDLDCRTLYLPLGVQSFSPLGVRREGFGFAGSESYRDRTGTGVTTDGGAAGQDKVDRVLGPFIGTPEFEWVSRFVWPEQLNMWYNQKLLTFGLHREGQRRWGIVNNRVFETLASGTPFVLEEHPEVDSVLGFEYPYQTSSRKETKDLVRQIRENPEETIEEFREYSERVREDHSYVKRVTTLFDELT